MDENGNAAIRPKSRVRRAVRRLVFLLVLPLVVLVIGSGALFYVFKGQQISNAAIDTRVQTSLQAVLGDAYSVQIAETGLSLISTSFLAITGKRVEISRADTGQTIALLEQVEVGLDTISLLQGNPAFNRLAIIGGHFAADTIDSEANALGMKNRLRGLGKQLSEASSAFGDGAIESVEIADFRVEGAPLARRMDDDKSLLIRNARIQPDKSGGIAVNASVSTGFSDLTVAAQWQRSDNADGHVFTAGIGPAAAKEWFPPSDPMTALIEPFQTGLGLDTTIRADLRVQFDTELEPGAPYLKLQAEGGAFRIGRFQNTPLNHVVANVRVDPESGMFVLERGEISLGAVTFQVAGNITPSAPDGMPGPWFIDASATRFSSTDPLWRGVAGEPKVAISGTFLPETRMLHLHTITLGGHDDVFRANVLVGLAPNTSASVTGSITAERVSVGTLQDFWPFHLAPKFRTWLRTRMGGGHFADLTASFEVAQGRLREVADGKGFLPQEFNLKTRLVDADIKTVGNLPELENASADLQIDGSQLTIDGIVAELDPPGKNKVRFDNARFEISDVFKLPVKGTLNGWLSGDLASMATLANLDPLNITDKIAVNPAALSGLAKANIDLTFPVTDRLDQDTLKWRADIKLRDASSSDQVFGQSISNADVEIKAVPDLVTVNGTATINGTAATLDLAEPLNGGATSKRVRTMRASIDHKVLAKRGIDISAIVTGKMDVTYNSDANGDERYEIDLKNADVSLPWISWLKGSGIPAKASFILTQAKGINTLTDFRFSGPTFKAAGKLAFNQSGLISASLRNVVLVRGDLFDVDVSRNSNRYTIKANGRSFDGRGIINKVIHGDGFDSEASTSDISVNANFGRLAGFNKQVMQNVLVRYNTQKGLLTGLEVRGVFDGQLSKIDARREGNSTRFEFFSDNAGAAMAMVDLYRKMEGGRLKSKLVRAGDGPFIGDVSIRNFAVAGEERLQSLVAAPAEERRLQKASGALKELDVQRVMFDDLKAKITKDEDYFSIKKGRLRNAQIGLTFDGTVYDQKNQMSVRGTFMPLFAISRLIGGIPLIGEILSNGKNSGLIGITYRLKGPAENPTMLVNPISIIAPGVFNEVFQFQE